MNDLCRFEPTQYTTAPHQTEGWIVFRESPDKVFARVADHAALGDWIPLVQEITVSHPHPVAPGESTIGTARAITFKGGLAVVETVVYWNPPHCYAYKGEGKYFPLKNYLGLFKSSLSTTRAGDLSFASILTRWGAWNKPFCRKEWWQFSRKRWAISPA